MSDATASSEDVSLPVNNDMPAVFNGEDLLMPTIDSDPAFHRSAVISESDLPSGAGTEAIAKRGPHDFIRFGRSQNAGPFPRLDRANQQGFIRLGRDSIRNDDILLPNGGSNGFLRLGRPIGEEYIHSSNNNNDKTVRYGRRGDQFIRFGRSRTIYDGKPANYQHFIRFGRAEYS